MLLTTLATEEERLMTIVGQQTGLMEVKHQALDRLGIFTAYAGIHRAYMELARSLGEQEALKRAIFLQWYAVSEPACFTGIFQLDTPTQQIVIEQLDQDYHDGMLDPESMAMLRWYYRSTGWYFDQFQYQFLLLTNLRENLAMPSVLELVARGDGHMRGQMGKYWQSILSTR